MYSVNSYVNISHVILPIPLFSHDGTEGAVLFASTALDALILIDDVGLFDFAANSTDGAGSLALCATFAQIGNMVAEQSFADAGRTSLVNYVSNILIAEVFHG